jgi:hypothetical protein
VLLRSLTHGTPCAVCIRPEDWRSPGPPEPKGQIGGVDLEQAHWDLAQDRTHTPDWLAVPDRACAGQDHVAEHPRPAQKPVLVDRATLELGVQQCAYPRVLIVFPALGLVLLVLSAVS